MLTARAARLVALAGAAAFGLAPVAPAASAATGPHFPRNASSQLGRDLKRAWRTTKGKGVTVAVVAYGMDPSTTGLAGKVTAGPSYGNLKHANPVPGTLLASAIAGRLPSPGTVLGTFGIAPAARILSIRVQPGAPNDTWQTDDARAIRYSVNHGAQVILLVETGYDYLERLDSAVGYALSKNVVIVTNEYGWGDAPSDPQYPNSLPGVLGASAMTLAGPLAPPHRWPAVANASILVSAPANLRYAADSTGTGAIYNNFDAAAWLTGTAALVKSAYPHLSPALVELATTQSARDHPAGGYSPHTGFGLINPAGALAEAARLSRLRETAATGPAAVSPAGRLAPGPAPGVIHAVHHSAAKLALLAGLAVVGLVLLGLAAAVTRAGRHVSTGR